MTRLREVPAAALHTIDVPGDGFEAGERYGAACAGLIAAHLEILVTRLEQRLGLDVDTVLARTAPYRDATAEAYPLLAGWRVGVPRYLYTRIALAEEDREAAVAAVEGSNRAAPRNLLIADSDGATNLETTPTDSERLEPSEGVLVHSDHFVSRLQEQEESPPALLRNSRRRLDRIRELLGQRHGEIDVDAIADALRDRANVPDAICDQPFDDPGREATTVASSIADIAARRLWVALGAPCDAPYRPYEVAG